MPRSSRTLDPRTSGSHAKSVRAGTAARIVASGSLALLLLLFANCMAVAQEAPPRGEAYPQAFSERLLPLEDPSDLDPLLAAAADKRVVMIGEASHGTSEFYLWRADLTRRLVEEHGFDFVVVEGDWPDLYDVNRYVRGLAGESAVAVLGTFERWPTWMWANWETVAFTEWLREHNLRLAPEERVGFYGLDVYSLWESLAVLLGLLEGEAYAAARDAALALEDCLAPYERDEQAYARATLDGDGCTDEADALVRQLDRYDFAGEEALRVRQNARVIVNALSYYHAMVRDGALSWNVRDRHMMATLEELLQHLGPAARGIVWAHNTHIGDARFTDMADIGMVNLGQLAREDYGEEDVLLVGFGTHHGTVIAADAWGAPAEVMPVPPARAGSVAAILAAAGERNWLLRFSPRAADEQPDRVPHRAIGVVYDPAREAFGSYVPTVLPLRYDAFLFLFETTALHPLGLEPDLGPPRLYPWRF